MAERVRNLKLHASIVPFGSLAAEGPSLASPPADAVALVGCAWFIGQLHGPGQLLGPSQLWINCDRGAIRIRRYRLFTWRI